MLTLSLLLSTGVPNVNPSELNLTPIIQEDEDISESQAVQKEVDRSTANAYTIFTDSLYYIVGLPIFVSGILVILIFALERNFSALFHPIQYLSKGAVIPSEQGWGGILTLAIVLSSIGIGFSKGYISAGFRTVANKIMELI